MNVCVDSLKSRRHAGQMYTIKVYKPRICFRLTCNTCDIHGKYRVRIITFIFYKIMKYLRFYLFIYIHVIYYDDTSFVASKKIIRSCDFKYPLNLSTWRRNHNPTWSSLYFLGSRGPSGVAWPRDEKCRIAEAKIAHVRRAMKVYCDVNSWDLGRHAHVISFLKDTSRSLFSTRENERFNLSTYVNVHFGCELRWTDELKLR